VVVVVVGATVVVVAMVVVIPIPKVVVGVTMLAIAGSAVVLRTIPATSEPIEPISTERRGPRRDVEERPLGSPEIFCPRVIFVMDQLSKINSKVLSTTPQHHLNSFANPNATPKSAGRVRGSSHFAELTGSCARRRAQEQRRMK
jgi:hypothetical protein